MHQERVNRELEELLAQLGNHSMHKREIRMSHRLGFVNATALVFDRDPDSLQPPIIYSKGIYESKHVFLLWLNNSCNILEKDEFEFVMFAITQRQKGEERISYRFVLETDENVRPKHFFIATNFRESLSHSSD